MYNIGIIGHSPEHFKQDHETIRRAVGHTIDLLVNQYGEDEIVFNIIGDIGVGLWAALHCLNEGYKYHLFLQYPEKDTSQHWYSDQANDLRMCYDGCFALSIGSPVPDAEEKKEYHTLVDISNFIICFWIGKKQGKTFDIIKHAIEVGRPVLHGFDNLRLITNADIRGKKNVRSRKN